ncbi:hypothetical protein WT53_11565 [Burkholderia sp. MSMB2157WGS]|nr:hypothetical protein WT53_11565 [Burkholderia sp. MSMB2157WGS]
MTMCMRYARRVAAGHSRSSADTDKKGRSGKSGRQGEVSASRRHRQATTPTGMPIVDDGASAENRFGPILTMVF